MSDLISASKRCLLVAAAPREARAVLDAFSPAPESVNQAKVIQLNDRYDLVMSGVGKSSAAAATAIACSQNPYSAVVSVGIAGALPIDTPLAIGTSLLATRSVFSDEGVGAPDGFTPMSKLGFPAFASGNDWIDHDPHLTELLSEFCDQSGAIATVSWCSGDDGCAQGVINRTGAIAEAMEGAAVALAAKMTNPDTLTSELRVISNTTGNRAAQVWDIDGALRKLTEVLGRLR
jgi:futalosine hydrolase